MDYGAILSRAANIIWEHKWLIILGVLVALGSSSPGTSGGGRVQLPLRSDGFDFRIPEIDPDMRLPQLERDFGLPALLAVVAGLIIAGIAIAVALLLWVISTIARGALIAGVNTIEAGAIPTLGEAWSAGWRRGWRLLGISLLPAIPALILAVIGLGFAGVFAATYAMLGGRSAVVPGAGLGVLWVTLSCIFVPIALILNLLQAFANRACMLEDVGVIAAYRRGLTVLVENIGPAIVLFILQVVIGLVLGVLLVVPRAIMVLCCILWPLLLLVQGIIATYFSTMWTLAWRQWTGMGRSGDVAPVGDVAAGA